MFQEKRMLHFGSPESRSYEEEPEIVSQTMDANAEMTDQLRPSDLEYAKGIAEIAMQAESGQMDEAAKNFYELFLKTPGKAKGYVDLMIASTTPLTYLTRKLPMLGWPYRMQKWVAGKGIDGLFKVIRGFKQMQDESPVYQTLENLEGEWDTLSPEDQEGVKSLLLGYLTKTN